MASSEARLAHGPALVDYARTLDCIHCGLCLQTCPTFRTTGAEPSSPRGRIHLMRGVAEGRAEPDASYLEELDFCLLCRHCESVCPAGVRFGEMMEGARDRAAWRGPWRRRVRTLLVRAGLRLVLPHRVVLRVLGSLVRLAQRLDPLEGHVAGREGRFSTRLLPALPARRERRLLPRELRPPEGTLERGAVALLEGCVVPELFPRVSRRTAESLAELGHVVRVPRGVTCCGSLHAHNGDAAGARALVRRLVGAWETLGRGLGAPPRLVVASAGCGAHLRECAHLFEAADPWRERAARLAAAVVDYSQVVAAPLLAGEARLRRCEGLPGPVAWDDPCHLCHGQGVRAEPRAILDRIPGLRRVELPDSESCCGSAGIYSVLRPADAAEVFAKKLAALDACGARTIVTENPGCHLQWLAGTRRAGRDVRVVHLAELVQPAP